MNYNSVIKSPINIYLSKKNKQLMFFENSETKIVRDLLTQEEISKILSIESNGSKGLIAMTDNNGSFKGYFPLNADLPSNLFPHRIDNELDIFPVVCGG